jgi:hypothetical protein
MSNFITSFKVYEKSIGIQKIYQKYYSHIKPEIFNFLISLDPTTPKPKNPISLKVDKPGRYVRWIVREYLDGHFDSYIRNDRKQELKFLREELKLLGTAWLKKRLGKNIDIFKYSYPQLTNVLGKALEDYRAEVETVDVKFDLLYEDDTWKIFVPLNPGTSRYLCGKDTIWCTNDDRGWDMWARQGYIFYRFIPKKNPYRKLRMTWHMEGLDNCNWAFSYSYSSVHYYPRDEDPFSTKVPPHHEIEEEIVANIEAIPEEARQAVKKYHSTVEKPLELVNKEAA